MYEHNETYSDGDALGHRKRMRQAGQQHIGRAVADHNVRECTWQGEGVDPRVLLHPLEELRPVAAQLGGGLPPGDWSLETVLWTSVELPLVLTVNQVGAALMTPAGGQTCIVPAQASDTRRARSIL